MARKTTGTTTTRSKKTAAAIAPATVETAPEVRDEIRKNGKAATQVTSIAVPVNLEEEIRRRAYELYLQRRATSNGNHGDENQDWFVAEREILSRQGGQDQHSA